MFKRVRDSLVYPKEILEYRKDHILFVLFYLFFFAFLLSTGSVIDVMKYDGLAPAYKNSIEENITVVTEDCEIANASLVCDGEYYINLYEEQAFTVYLFSEDISMFSEYPSQNYSIVISEDHIYFYLIGVDSLSIPISDLPDSFHNIDFADQTTDPSGFYSSLFNGLDDLLIDSKNVWGPMMIASEIIISIIFYLVFVLISSWFLKIRYKVIPFKETFVMTTYSSTSLFIILTFYSMLELDLIIIIILLIISFRQNGVMSKEIDRRLKKKS